MAGQKRAMISVGIIARRHLHKAYWFMSMYITLKQIHETFALCFVVLWYAVDVKWLVDNIHTIQATAFKNMTGNKSHEHNKDYSKQRNRMHCLWDILYRISYIADIKFSAIFFLRNTSANVINVVERNPSLLAFQWHLLLTLQCLTIFRKL